jgi:Flp pilus assembly protein TadG
VQDPNRRSIWERLRIRRHSRGQGLVEFALVLPVLALFFMSILQFGVLFSAQVGITNAVREAVRNASAIPVADSVNAGTAANSVYARLTVVSTLTPGLLQRNVSSYSTGALVTSGSPLTQVCYSWYSDATGGISIMARVQVVYDHPLFIPLISGILDGFDGNTNAANPAYRLVTSEEIRVANGPLTSAGGIGGIGSPTCNL